MAEGGVTTREVEVVDGVDLEEFNLDLGVVPPADPPPPPSSSRDKQQHMTRKGSK